LAALSGLLVRLLTLLTRLLLTRLLLAALLTTALAALILLIVLAHSFLRFLWNAGLNVITQPTGST
jgi:hypothetical protein